MSATFSIEEMNQLSNALEKAGWTSPDVDKLTQCEKLEVLKAFVNGFAKLELYDYSIDCNVLPKYRKLATGKIKRHKKGGVIDFYLSNTSLSSLYYCVSGSSVLKILANRPLANANVLEYLFEHQELVPEIWRGKRIFFLNTVYINKAKDELIRYMFWSRNTNSWVKDIHNLTERFGINDVALMIEPQSEIKSYEHFIDCKANLFIPDDWGIERHKEIELLKFEPLNVSLYLSKKQQQGVIIGNDLRKILAKKSLMNANVLDYLLANTEQVPDDWKPDGPDRWKGKHILFWGTIYRLDKRLCVRYLYWNDTRWCWSYRFLDDLLCQNDYAALYKT